jgi:hypothetical protein
MWPAYATRRFAATHRKCGARIARLISWLSTSGRPRASGRLATAFPPNPTLSPCYLSLGYVPWTGCQSSMRHALILCQAQFRLYLQGLCHVFRQHRLAQPKTPCIEFSVRQDDWSCSPLELALKINKPCAGFPYAGPGLGGNFVLRGSTYIKSLSVARVTVQMRYLFRRE